MTWRPALFDPAREADRAALHALRDSGEVRFVHDTIRDQLGELIGGRQPARTWKAGELDERIAAHAGTDLENYGTWVHYPWSARLVHVLPRAEYREVRSDRNRYKLTLEEQERLRSTCVGVCGLSVGNMAAVTLALEGIGGTLKIADFDTLSLSNLNRLRGGCHELGVNKTILAAREIAEIDPYTEVVPFMEGITGANIDAFLDGLDLLVEECDDLYVKVLIRQKARERRLPVIMDTSDRGLVDIERFDLEPDRPLFHGLIGDVDPASLAGLPTRDKVPFVLAILGGHQMSLRMAASLPEVKESISSWPQLASQVAYGGGFAADVARRLLLGDLKRSGRFRIDLDRLIRDGAGELTEAVAPPPPIEISPETQRVPVMPARPAPGDPIEDVVRFVVAYGALAPSAHNAQPWTFTWRDGRLECRHDPAHDLPSLDYDHGATWLAFGALAETIELAAAEIGFVAETRTFPDPADERLVCTVRVVPGNVDASPLFAQVIQRMTNRKRGQRVPLAEAEAMALTEAATARGARLQLISSPAGLDEAAALLGAGDRLSWLDPHMHKETMDGFRWTREAVEGHRDGIDVTTMEFSAADRAAFQLLSAWRTMEVLRAIGGGRALEDGARKSVAVSSAVGLVTTEGTSPQSYFQAGRAVQGIWLTATRLGLALQPWTALPYLFARVERGGGEGLIAEDVDVLRGLRRRWAGLFEVDPGRAEAFLFRIGRAEAPSARSLRRHLDQVLSFR